MTDSTPGQSASHIQAPPAVDEQIQEPPEQPDVLPDPGNVIEAGSDSQEQEESDGASHDGSSGAQLADEFDMEHVFENGRRYANETSLFPNDEAEETRLAIVHQIHLSLLQGELSLSRGLQRPTRILDVGSGPGDWAIAIGEAFPLAKVIAMDITTYQSLNAPPNVEFRIEDASQEWSYDEPFDFIHMRDIHYIPDYMHVLRQCHKWLKERGTFEFVSSGPIGMRKNFEGSALQMWNDCVRESMANAGVDCYIDFKNKDTIQDTGLRVYKQKHITVRMGDWTAEPEQRRVGRMALVASCEGIEASSMRALTKYLGWTAEKAQELFDKVMEEVMNPGNEPYIEVDYIVATRLPVF